MTATNKVDYSDYKVWKEEELTSHEYNFGIEHEYTPLEVYTITTELIDIAIRYGLEGCFLRFESHMDPYEEYKGPPSVTPCGYRKVTTGERKEYERQDRIAKKAEELGIPFYKANILMELQEQGII